MDTPTTEMPAINSKPAAGKCIKVLNTVRIVLLGQSKAGKSSLANTIFGEDTFKTDGVLSPGLLEAKSKTIHGKRITLIDTPGLFNPNISDQEMKSEIVRCTTECAPQPHAFLIVLKVKNPKELEAVITKIHKYFSDDIFKFATVVFTHGNQLPPGKKIEEFVHENKVLSDLVKKCGGRWHIVDNKFWKVQQDDSRSNQFQVAELLKTIEKMVLETLGGSVSNRMLQAMKKDEKLNMNIRNMLMSNTSKDAQKRTSKDVWIKLTGPEAKSFLVRFLGSVVLLETGAATRGGTEAAEPEGDTEPEAAPPEKEAEGLSRKSVNREPKNVWIKVTGPAAESVAEAFGGAADLQEVMAATTGAEKRGGATERKTEVAIQDEKETEAGEEAPKAGEEEAERDETEAAPRDVEAENAGKENTKAESQKIKPIKAVKDGEAAQTGGDANGVGPTFGRAGTLISGILAAAAAAVVGTLGVGAAAAIGAGILGVGAAAGTLGVGAAAAAGAGILGAGAAVGVGLGAGAVGVGLSAGAVVVVAKIIAKRLLKDLQQHAGTVLLVIIFCTILILSFCLRLSFVGCFVLLLLAAFLLLCF